MIGDGSLEYWYREASHSSSRHLNHYGVSDDGSIGVYVGDGTRIFWSQDTIHYYSCNRGVYRCVDQSVDNGRCGFRYQDNIDSSFHNRIESVDGCVIGGDSYQTSHSSSHNPGERGILSCISFYSRPVDKKIYGDDISVYWYQTSHSPPHNPGERGIFLGLSVASHYFDESFHSDERGDHSGYDGRREFRSQDTSHYSFHNYGESFDGDDRGGYMSHTIHSPSHNPGSLSRLLGFYVSGDDRGGHMFHNIQFHSHNYGGQCRYHSRFPQDTFPSSV